MKISKEYYLDLIGNLPEDFKDEGIKSIVNCFQLLLPYFEIKEINANFFSYIIKFDRQDPVVFDEPIHIQFNPILVYIPEITEIYKENYDDSEGLLSVLNRFIVDRIGEKINKLTALLNDEA